VVVVNHNGGAVTVRCLDALARTEWPPEALEVVLVDNASTDGVAAELRADGASVRVLSSDVNLGFGRACNLAMAELTDVDFVALVNNDAVPEPGWLAPLVEAVSAGADIGAACPKILLTKRARGVVLEQADEPALVLTLEDADLDGPPVSARVVVDERWRPALGGRPQRWTTHRPEAGLWWPEDGSSGRRARLRVSADRAGEVVVDSSIERVEVSVGPVPTAVDVALPTEAEDVINSVGGVLYEGWFGGDRGYLELDRGQYDAPAEVFSWSGAGVLLAVPYLRDVGLFNPDFFLYYEDFELAWRGRSKGWRYMTAPQSVLRHEHGFTSDVGSARFREWEGRNRRLTMMELAPGSVALRALGGGLRHAAGLHDALGFASAATRALSARRRLPRLPADALDRWLTPRPGVP
jgi:GT2 family glycosyltransferase